MSGMMRALSTCLQIQKRHKLVGSISSGLLRLKEHVEGKKC